MPSGYEPTRVGSLILWADRYDPDERFSLHPLTGEQVLRRLLGVADDEPAEDECEPDSQEDEDS